MQNDVVYLFVFVLCIQAVIVLEVVGVTAHPMVEDIAIKLVFANAMLNPIFYGLCRRNYRKGYDYVSQLFCYRITCGCIKKPGGECALQLALPLLGEVLGEP